MPDFVRYNCGEYAPGLEPIIVGNTNSTTDPVIVVGDPGNIDPPYIPYDPEPPYTPASSPYYNQIIPGVVFDPPPNNGFGQQDPALPAGVTLTEPQIPSVQVNFNSAIPAQAQVTTGNGSEPLFNRKHNIFRFPENNETSYVSNSRYLEIFAPLVSQEVGHFLDRENSTAPWDERNVFGLTNQNLFNSLNPQLKTAISNLHGPGGLRVSPTSILNGLKKHLFEGTLDQVDPSFYQTLANMQSRDTRLSFVRSPVKDHLTRGALGFALNGKISADPNSLDGYTKRIVNRQRRLNTDINAQILVDPLSQEEQYMSLEDAGIPVVAESGTHCEIGDGAGYYIHCTLIDGSEEPCPLRTDVSAAYFIPADLKNICLNAMNESSFKTFTVSSTSANELTSSAIPAYSLEPKYFALDLTSVEDVPTENPFISRTKCRYTLLEDEQEIQRHTLNNGIAVSKLNVNFDDPFIRYALETSTIELAQNDLTFKNFDENRSIVGNAILCRQMPFAIVLSPGAGSRHNPFNGNSKIGEFSTIVTRTIQGVPHIDVSEGRASNSPLTESNITNQLGMNKVGLVEDFDVQGRSFTFDVSTLANSFYSNGEYTTANRTPENYGYSYLLNNIVDPLIQNNNASSLTWWDVYCRMPLNRFCEIMYDPNKYLHNSIARGYRNGVTIKNVLARPTEDEHPFIEGDDIILDSEQRQ